MLSTINLHFILIFFNIFPSLILHALCNFPVASAAIIVPSTQSNSIHNKHERYESEPALFGKPFEIGLHYSAHLQVVSKEDEYLCGGVYDAKDNNNDDDKVNNGFHVMKKDAEKEGTDEDEFDKSAESLTKVFRSLVNLQEKQLKNSRKNKNNYDIVVPKDGLPVALIVKRGQCSFETKARTAMKLNAPPNVIQYLIVYDDKERSQLVPMSANVSRGIDVGLLFTSLKSGIALMHHISSHHTLSGYHSKDSLPILSASKLSSTVNVDEASNLHFFPNYIDGLKDQDIAGGPVIILDSEPPDIPSIYQDTQEWIVAVLAGFIMFFSCLSCIFFCIQSGYITVQDGVIIVGNRGPLPEGWNNGMGGNGTGVTQRLLTVEDVHKLPEFVYYESKLNKNTKNSTSLQNDDPRRSKDSKNEMKDKNRTFLTTDHLFDCNSCSVCLDEYVEGDILLVLPCKHSFHKDCIIPWLTERQATCPLCKSEVLLLDTDTDSDGDVLHDSTPSTPLSSTGISSSISSTFTPASSVNSSVVTEQDVMEQGVERRNEIHIREVSSTSWVNWFRGVERSSNRALNDSEETTEQRLSRPLLEDQ